jgi:hypothetical protein
LLHLPRIEVGAQQRRRSSGKDSDTSETQPPTPRDQADGSTMSSIIDSMVYTEETTRRNEDSSRYLGSSAGTGFVSLVEHVLGATDATERPNQDLSQTLRANRTTGRPTPVYSPPARRPTCIPPKSVALMLVSSYFTHWHITFPLLHRPSFMALVERMYDEPQLYYRDSAGAFVFDMVLALGSAGSKKFEWSFKDTDSHFRRGMSKLDTIETYRDLRTVQAHLMCCQYGIHATLRDTAEEMWNLIGKASRLCVELGLHQTTASQRSYGPSIHLTGHLPEAVDNEMRRRCFWCFYSLERYVKLFALGRDDLC